LATALATTVEREGTRLRVPGEGTLPIDLELEDDAAVVRLSGWSRTFELDGDPDDARDEADLALDLIAAALFGVVRVVEKTANGRAHHWTLQVREGDGWSIVSSTGAPSLNPFARRETRLLHNAVPRPPELPAAAKIGLPWAPWAGAGGFSPLADPAQSEATLPVDGVLDLHNFSPKEVKPLVLEYIEQCRQAGIYELRIIHGKGTGQLRRTVHALLDRHEHVDGYRLGGHGGGSWGATIVDLEQ
jgi:hypothetical protein